MLSERIREEHSSQPHSIEAHSGESHSGEPHSIEALKMPKMKGHIAGTFNKFDRSTIGAVHSGTILLD